MLDDPLKYGLLAALAIALVVVLIGDLRHRRISNWLNAAIAISAPLFWWATDLDLWPDIALQFGVALLTFVICAVVWRLGGLGGGDLKLLTALALWIAPALFLKLVVWMSLIGGTFSFAILIVRVMRRQKVRVFVPYGPAIAMAGLGVIGIDYFHLTTVAGGVG